MEKLSVEQRESLKKLSNERLRAKLVKLGFDEELVFSTKRADLLNMLAEHMLNPQRVVGAEMTPSKDVRLCELSLKEQ